MPDFHHLSQAAQIRRRRIGKAFEALFWLVGISTLVAIALLVLGAMLGYFPGSLQDLPHAN